MVDERNLITNNVEYNENELLINPMSFDDFINVIRKQSETTKPSKENIDYIKIFINNFLHCTIEEVEDLSIYINPNITQEDRETLNDFTGYMIQLLYSCFSIRLEEPDIKLIYYLYRVFVVNIYHSLLYCLIGINTFDKFQYGSTGNEDLDDSLDTLKLEYFKEKNKGDKSLTSEYSLVREYILHTFSTICPQFFFTLCYYGCEGNVVLNDLLYEEDNFRLIIEDNDFFTKKIMSFIECNEIIDSLVTEFIDTLNI